jgi:hypothetical protein
MSGKSSEQAAFEIIKSLDPQDRRLCHDWVSRTGCDWVTALLNSGVTTPHRRTTPEQEARAAARREADEALDYHLRAIAPIDGVQRRKRSAEHQAAHSVVAAAFGAGTSVMFVGRESGGMCVFDDRRPRGTSPGRMRGPWT